MARVIRGGNSLLTNFAISVFIVYLVSRRTSTGDQTQPNTDGTDGDCLMLNGTYDFSWHDVTCAISLGFPLCELR